MMILENIDVVYNKLKNQIVYYVVHRVSILLPVSKIVCDIPQSTFPTLRWRWINLGMFVFRTYKNHRSEIASSCSPSLLQMLETEIEKKRKNETSEDFGGEETGCID